MIKLFLLLLLASTSWAYTPPKVDKIEDVDNALLEMSQEINRISLKGGGEVHQNVDISSSAHITGGLKVDGAVEIDGALTQDGNATFGSSVTLNGGMFGPQAVIWANFEGQGDPTINDSFHIVEVSSVAAGEWIVHFSNDFANVNFSCTCSAQEDGGGRVCIPSDLAGNPWAVGSFRLEARDFAGTNEDVDIVNVICVGKP